MIATFLPLAQQMTDPQAAGFLTAFLGIICFALVIVLAIQALFCYFAAALLTRLPEQYRQQTPGMVWLLMIPLFSLVWNFFVWPKISASYANYFRDQGNVSVGNANGTLALTYCILACCGIIPYLGGLAALAGLICLIIWLVQMSALKNQIPVPPV